jgi:hypothetical protein
LFSFAYFICHTVQLSAHPHQGVIDRSFDRSFDRSSDRSFDRSFDRSSEKLKLSANLKQK